MTDRRLDELDARLDAVMARLGGRRLKEKGVRCPYCRQPMRDGGEHRATPDHLWAHSKGGRAGLNILYVCWRCNQDKAAMSLAEFADWLETSSDSRAPVVNDLMRRSRSVFHVNFDPTK